MIPFYKTQITKSDIESVCGALRDGWVTRGKRVERLEELISNSYSFGDKNVFCTDSNTAGMELCLRYLGIGDGDEVITTPLTYTATADVIINVGAKPIFVDTYPDKPFMDISKIKITPKTKAIIGMDYGGQLDNYRELFKLSAAHENNKCKFGRPAVIADAAHSFGLKNPMADFVVHSFHAVKNITTGEGGCIIMNKYNNDIYKTISLLSDHGQGEKSGWEYDIELFGQNHIMTDIHAALGLSQVSRTKEVLLGRATRSGIYSELLKCDYFHRGKDLKESTFHLASVFLPEYCDRNMIYNIMKERYGIVCNVHFKPLPMMTAYKKAGYNIKHYPNSERLFERELTLPLYNGLSFGQIEYIAESLNRCIKEFEE